MNNADGDTIAPINVDLLVKREQAEVLAGSRKSTLLANSFVAVCISILLVGHVPAYALAFWLGLLLLVNVGRLINLYMDHHSSLTQRDPALFMQHSWIGALASGLVWTGLFYLTALHGLTFSPAIGIGVAGLTAGAVINGNTHRATVWALIIPIELARIASIFATGTFEGYIIGPNIILYFIMMCQASAQSERSFVASSRLKHEANELADSLKKAHGVAGKAVTRLDFLANHDPLTGLSNRAAFRQTFDRALDDARLMQREVTLVLVDLDRFKAINDTFGHAMGDQVLMSAARRMRAIVGNDQFVARLGGDEFAIILQSEEAENRAHELTSALIESLGRPIVTSERQVSVSASIGYALYPRDGFNVEELQISADVALYAAKAAGRSMARGFDEKLRAATDARRVYELDLADALADDSLEVWFQPQIRLSDQTLVGFESLIRWKHPNHGWVPPPEIVLAAAATHQSEALTTFVVAASCRMIRALNLAGRDDVSVSFNASPQELGRYSLADLIARALAAHNVRPESLEVEITEEAMLSQERGSADLHSIAAMGVRIAIDDFGVGYSSFGALKTLKFDCIKIDRVFVEGVTNSADDRALVQAILGVSRALGVKAIAEGVETADQAVVLASLGCNEVQGYYFARPMPAKKALEWMAEQAKNLRKRMAAEPLHAIAGGVGAESVRPWEQGV